MGPPGPCQRHDRQYGAGADHSGREGGESVQDALAGVSGQFVEGGVVEEGVHRDRPLDPPGQRAEDDEGDQAARPGEVLLHQLQVSRLDRQPEDEEGQQCEGAVDRQDRREFREEAHSEAHRDRDRQTVRELQQQRRQRTPPRSGQQEPEGPLGVEETQREGVTGQHRAADPVQGLEDHVGDQQGGDDLQVAPRGRPESAGEVAGDQHEGRHVEAVDQQVESVPGHRVMGLFDRVADDDQDDQEPLGVVQVRVALRADLRVASARSVGASGVARLGWARLSHGSQNHNGSGRFPTNPILPTHPHSVPNCGSVATHGLGEGDARHEVGAGDPIEPRHAVRRGGEERDGRLLADADPDTWSRTWSRDCSRGRRQADVVRLFGVRTTTPA